MGLGDDRRLFQPSTSWRKELEQLWFHDLMSNSVIPSELDFTKLCELEWLQKDVQQVSSSRARESNGTCSTRLSWKLRDCVKVCARLRAGYFTKLWLLSNTCFQSNCTCHHHSCTVLCNDSHYRGRKQDIYRSKLCMVAWCVNPHSAIKANKHGRVCPNSASKFPNSHPPHDEQTLVPLAWS